MLFYSHVIWLTKKYISEGSNYLWRGRDRTVYMGSTNCENWSKCTGASMKDAPALSLTPGSFLLLLVLLPKIIKRLLCRISEFIQLTSCEKYIEAKKGQWWELQSVPGRLGERGHRKAGCSLLAEEQINWRQLQNYVHWHPVKYSVTACSCWFRKMLLKQAKSSPRSLDL